MTGPTNAEITAAYAALPVEQQFASMRGWTARYVPFLTEAARRLADDGEPTRAAELEGAPALALERVDRILAGENVTTASGKPLERLFSLVKRSQEPPVGEWAWVLPAWHATQALRLLTFAAQEHDVPRWAPAAAQSWARIETLFPISDEAFSRDRRIGSGGDTDRFATLEPVGLERYGEAVLAVLGAIIQTLPQDPGPWSPPDDLWDRRDYRAGDHRRPMHRRTPRPGERLRAWYASDRDFTVVLDELAAAEAYAAGRELWLRVLPERPEDALGATSAMAELGFRVDGTAVVFLQDALAGQTVFLFEPIDGRLFLSADRDAKRTMRFWPGGQVSVDAGSFAGEYDDVDVARHWLDRPAFGDWIPLLDWRRTTAFWTLLAGRAMRAAPVSSTSLLATLTRPEGIDEVARAALTRDVDAANASRVAHGEPLVLWFDDDAATASVRPATLEAVGSWLSALSELRRAHPGDWTLTLDDREVAWSEDAGYRLPER